MQAAQVQQVGDHGRAGAMHAGNQSNLRRRRRSQRGAGQMLECDGRCGAERVQIRALPGGAGDGILECAGFDLFGHSHAGG